MANDIDRDTVRIIVEEVLKAAPPREETIRETVHETLTELGIDHAEPREMQKDFAHLREARVTMEQIRNKGIMALVGFLVAGVLSASWLGIKHYFQ